MTRERCNKLKTWKCFCSAPSQFLLIWGSRAEVASIQQCFHTFWCLFLLLIPIALSPFVRGYLSSSVIFLSFPSVSKQMVLHGRCFRDFVIFLFYLFGSRPDFLQSAIPVLLVIAETCQYCVGYWQLCYFLLLSLLYHIFQFVKHRFESTCMYVSNLVSVKTQLKTFHWETWCFIPPWWSFLYEKSVNTHFK